MVIEDIRNKLMIKNEIKAAYNNFLPAVYPFTRLVSYCLKDSLTVRPLALIAGQNVTTAVLHRYKIISQITPTPEKQLTGQVPQAVPIQTVDPAGCSVDP